MISKKNNINLNVLLWYCQTVGYNLSFTLLFLCKEICFKTIYDTYDIVTYVCKDNCFEIYYSDLLHIKLSFVFSCLFCRFSQRNLQVIVLKMATCLVLCLQHPPTYIAMNHGFCIAEKYFRMENRSHNHVSVTRKSTPT